MARQDTSLYKLVGGGNHGMKLSDGRHMYVRGDELRLTESQADKMNKDTWPIPRVELVKGARAESKGSRAKSPVKRVAGNKVQAAEKSQLESKARLVGDVATVVEAIKSVTDPDQLGRLFDLEAAADNRKTVLSAITEQLMTTD